MKRKLLLTVLSLSILIFCITLLGILVSTRVNPEYTIEAGQTVSADKYRAHEWDQAKFEWVQEPDTSAPGSYSGKIYVFPIEYDVTLHVTDTIAPVVTTQDTYVFYGEEVVPEQFIASVQDVSSYHIDFMEEPDTTKYGFQKVSLFVMDEKGNRTEASAELYVVNIKEQVTINLGESLPPAEAFLADGIGEISYITDRFEPDLTQEGTTELRLLVDGIEASAVLHVLDLEAPVLELCALELWMNKPVDAEQFVLQVTDNSGEATVAYAAEPDWSAEGEQKVALVAVDARGNSVTEETLLTILRDEKSPTVTVTDIDVQVGGTVSYKKAVSYYDNLDSKSEMKLSIDRSSVNLDQVGSYEVIYTVTDCSENTVSVIGRVNVLAEAPKWEDEEAIHAKAKEILDSILEEGMTDREKAKKIYNWVKRHIGYIKHSEKGNYMRGAYEGLFERQGDCFVYAATSKELLTQAGLQNIDIKKSRTNPSHYWNLVYIEDGWYHFDTTPRASGGEFFLLTDAELEAYSTKHNDTHIYDKSLYPEVK